MARQKFEPTQKERDQVEALSSYGIAQEQICLLITRPNSAGVEKPISKPTLRKYFATEIAIGTPKLLGMVADALAKTAVDRKHAQHVVAARFILKARGGWRETSEIDVHGSLDLDLNGATTEELEVLQRFLKRKVGGDGPRAANAA